MGEELKGQGEDGAGKGKIEGLKVGRDIVRKDLKAWREIEGVIMNKNGMMKM